MKNKEELIEGATAYFEYYKKVEEIFATTDSQYFLNESKANSHQASLKDKETKKALKIVKPSDSEAITLPEGDPTEKWKVNQIKKFLTDNEVEFGSDDTKSELLSLIKK